MPLGETPDAPVEEATVAPAGQQTAHRADHLDGGRAGGVAVRDPEHGGDTSGVACPRWRRSRSPPKSRHFHRSSNWHWPFWR